jgi:hypothetical protein
VVIAENDTTSGIAFQLAPDHQPPQWPNPDRPQQYHLDVMVDDVDAAEPKSWTWARNGYPATTVDSESVEAGVPWGS